MTKYRFKEAGERIDRLRKERKLTKAELGRRCGRSWDTVHKWTQGLFLPQDKTMETLCMVLGTSKSYILTGLKVVDPPTMDGPLITPGPEKESDKVDDLRFIIDTLKEQLAGLRYENRRLYALLEEKSKANGTNGNPL